MAHLTGGGDAASVDAGVPTVVIEAGAVVGALAVVLALATLAGLPVNQGSHTVATLENWFASMIAIMKSAALLILRIPFGSMDEIESVITFT